MLKMMKTFVKYDQDFEYGADLPQFLLKLVHLKLSIANLLFEFINYFPFNLREWKNSKMELLKVFKEMTDSILKQEGSGQFETSHMVLDMLLSIVDQECAHGYALLLLWASQSNAIPVCLTAICN